MPEIDDAHIEEIDVELLPEPEEPDEGVIDATDTYVEGIDDET